MSITLKTRKFFDRLKFYTHLLKCAIIISLFFPIRLFPRREDKKIWLIGENSGETLKDNGYFFFKYCCENQESSQYIFFITQKKYILKDSYLKSKNNLIIYGSVKHIIYLFRAHIFIYSQSHRDILYDPLFYIISKNKKIVSLKHGVFGLKKAIDYFIRHRNEADIITAVSEFEKSILTNQINIDPQKIRITGLARFDFLEDESCDDNTRGQILFMPTWRDWITIKDFFRTNFYINISKLMQNQLLMQLLKDKNIILKIYLHKIMYIYSTAFMNKSEQIEIIKFGEKDVQTLLKESDLLITDYSSVSWDFYYMEKPIIFYQFDFEEYLYHRGSYLNFKKDLFGDCVFSQDDLIELIRFYVDRNFVEKNEFKKSRSYFFKYHDHSNCKRIFDEIMHI